MWILQELFHHSIFAFSSSMFAGLTTILAKIRIKDTDSNLTTAITKVPRVALELLLF